MRWNNLSVALKINFPHDIVYGSYTVVSFNILIINSESPVMHWCHIKERNKSTSPGWYLTKRKPRFECYFTLPPSSVVLSMVVWEWIWAHLMLSCESVLYVCVCMCLCMPVWVHLTLTKVCVLFYWTEKESQGEWVRDTV